MEFPRHLHKPNGVYVICPDQGKCDALLALGWTLLPEAHVEQPIEVHLAHALAGEAPVAPATSAPKGGGESLVADLSVDDAKPIIAAADAAQLDAIEAEETAGKHRKGILGLIEVRRADLLDD